MSTNVNIHRLLSTTDGTVWAEEFTDRFSSCWKQDENLTDEERSGDLEGLMQGWFANAIETAKTHTRPKLIFSVEELEALPEGSAVLDVDKDVSTKHNGKWHGYEMAPLETPKFAKCGPFTVLYEARR